MYVDEYLRNKIYFIIDKLKKVTVLNKIKELNFFYSLSTENQLEIINKKLENLLSEVIMEVSFYRNSIEFSNFPVINKKDISNDAEAFLSKKYIKENLIQVHTSGSYGTPVNYYLTPEKKKNQLAEVIYYSQKTGYDVGLRHGYFRSNPHKSKLKCWLQNEIFFISKVLNEDFAIKGISSLREGKLKSLIGFPSAIAYLAKHCIEKRFKPKDFKITGVIASSENLTTYQRDLIHQAFDCKIQSRYSTEELGVLGIQSEKNGLFELNTCNYITEILKLDTDQPVLKGEIGRIVVTDLNSNAMPLIRYETGDLGVLGEFFNKKLGWAKSISQLSGRVMQIIYSTNGEILYPLYFDSIMDQYNIFSQYQIIQSSNVDFIIKLVKNKNFDEKTFTYKSFIKKFKDWLGKDAVISIEFVDDIEKLPSGKRPYIINLYKQYAI